MEIKEKDSKVEKIIIKYEDGTEKEIAKGAVINMTSKNEDEVNLNFEFTDFTGTDLTNMVFGVMQMGQKMGMFDND